MDQESQQGKDGQRFVERHGRTQRLAHWWVTVFFAAAILTAPGDARGHTAVLVAHVLAATALIVGALVVLLGGDRQALAADLRALRFDDTDRAWVRSLRGKGAESRPVRWGKFNTGQKVTARALLVLVVALLLSGAFDAISGSKTIHPPLFAATMLVLAGHVFMAVVNPSTRPALRGMVRGSVDRAWARHHHPAWLDEVDPDPGSDPDPVPGP
ncbi:MAG: formate dehydrogenase subunit gamma [Actinomycetota bacterium]|nr:formate dehydrogenase subunit gamma [Actinomycetota bacterium]MDQ1294669.1 formate dehydrogenase subunit gamma [Actinomycetota bacterium]